MFYFLLFLPFLQLLQLLQPLHAEQSPEQPPFLIICMITSTRAITISASRIMLGIFISSIISPYAMPKIIPTQRTRSAIIHAIAHCINTVTAAERTLPSSRFTVAIAATHGVYSRGNTRKTSAVNGVNSMFSAPVSPPSRTVRVETTLSFAVRPVIRAVEAL